MEHKGIYFNTKNSFHKYQNGSNGCHSKSIPENAAPGFNVSQVDHSRYGLLLSV